MSIFAILDYEPEIQIGDKTRLDVSKSFSSKAIAEMTSLTVKPELTSSYTVECLNPSLNDRYLDWAYADVSIDVGTDNDDLSFNVGSQSYSINLAAGTYTLSQYAALLATSMGIASSQTYTASVSNYKITISAISPFEFKASSVATQSFFKLGVSSTAHISGIVEYGNKIVTVVASNGSDTDTKYFYIKVYTELGDHLFCNDGDLVTHEPDIMKWVPEGRATYKNVFRRAQKLILAWLDEKGYVNTYGKKYDKNDIIDVEETRQWAIFMSLKLIFRGLSNSTDDVFDKKSIIYSEYEEAARQRVVLRIDVNKDGIADTTEGLNVSSGTLFRR